MRLSLTLLRALALGLGFWAAAAPQGNAQSADKKTALSIYGSTLQYHGDLGSEWFTRNKVEYGVGLTLDRYVTRGLAIGLSASYGDMKFNADPPRNELYFLENKTVRGFDANVVNVGIPLRLKLNNSWALKEDAFFAPYLVVQPGVFFASTDRRFTDETQAPSNVDIYAFDLMGAAGIKLQFSPGFSLFVQTGQHYPLSDRVDGVAGKGTLNDRYLQHTAGLTFGLGKTRDADHDGVADRKDKCPGTPAGVAVDANGCPLDGDGDGVPDYQDKCPTEKGVVTLEGCPDRDGDGIRDGDDKCPDTPGRPERQGCPDTDADGVIDPNDKCPNTPAGTPVDANGCPRDTDGDGVPDSKDRCPNRPGPAANHGCPEIKAETRKVLNEATKYIQFEFNKAVLKPSSYPKLQELVSILNEYSDYNLGITGHTDNVGNDAYNLQLSRDRAAAARTYMLSKGIAGNRIESRGYGETRPIRSNTTPQGQTLNRRVDFDLYLPGDANPAETRYGPVPMAARPAAPTKKAPVLRKAPIWKGAPVRKGAPAWKVPVKKAPVIKKAPGKK
ncbi:OmpA family protein [Hymenobacter cavernae]|uniref:OmpA-like domain-containing protein n=1 Tax=Hymenobacter cavernae TaxID=2044852 RepID=A0ABQ1U3A6_9BACT|nr:OmpA family protein [Hymenobacter cavernae]GGF08078.1 hypothetical protein GCM10011383_19030 [Hymenobacter cavernae]